ncbi:EAL domain-containing protein [Curvibacter sp. RS43]|uniref:EAL domain-containing protein n=1 Tax=Curvibacter microcysteis TaxID=3026419 RepID=UPI00235FBF6B|nr:GGDEF domain-containing phosphodiesterase [Curvibacter sp. RS43]MDD0810858.1 EAL domain-containing protein [Curvibacter sp. RS43]
MALGLVDLMFESLKRLAPDTPLLCLQGAALVGLLAAVLLVSRRLNLKLRERSLAMGVAVGLTGYVVGALASTYGEGVVRPTLVIDFLFLGAFLGGRVGGLACFALVELARWQFAGILHPWAALADGSVHVMAGWLMRHVLDPQALLPLRLRTVFWVWAVRLASTVVGALVGALISDSADEVLISVWRGRATVLPISFIIIYSLLQLLSNDAQIDAQQAREQEALRLDPVSGLANRRALNEFMVQSWQGTAERPACLAVLELGNVRDFLSRYGHEQACQQWRASGLEQGGALLQEVLGRLRVYRPWAFQYSDFSLGLFLDGVSLPHLEASRELEPVLLRCEQGLAEAWPGFRPVLRCAVVELASPSQTEGLTVPYREITMALNSLFAGVAYFNGLMQRDTALDAFIESQLGFWSDPARMPIWLQPKLNLVSGQVMGAEALLRLNDPQERPIAPMRVISALRRCGRLFEFEWASVTAVVHLLRRFGRGLPGVSMAVNVSAESLRRQGFSEAVWRLLAQCQVPPDQLRLEIVEWSELVNDPQVRDNLQDLSARGVPLSIDDFGTGYSNLLLLTRFPFSEVKIDQTLVNSLDDLKSLAVVEHIVELAHRCQASVVAEGVETPSLAAQVRSLGADMGQGYLFSQALPPDEFLAYCQRPPEVLPA